jgi:hypothetical protein
MGVGPLALKAEDTHRNLLLSNILTCLYAIVLYEIGESPCWVSLVSLDWSL